MLIKTFLLFKNSISIDNSRKHQEQGIVFWFDAPLQPWMKNNASDLTQNRQIKLWGCSDYIFPLLVLENNHNKILYVAVL